MSREPALHPDALREDESARRAAQEVFDRPLVLEAGAGTGKTSVLVARVLAWCLGPGWERAEGRLATAEAASASAAGAEAWCERIAVRVLEGVVAITFTEAAAAEMERRISQALTAVSQGGSVLGFDVVPPLPDERLRQRARALEVSLDALEVRTIHGFCHRLVSEHPLEAGVPPHFEIDASGRLREEAVRELLGDCLRDPGALGIEAELRELESRGIGLLDLEAALSALAESGVAPEAFASDPLALDRLAALAARVGAALEDLLRVESGRLASLRRSPRVTRALEDARALAALLGEGPAGPEAAEAWLERVRARASDELMRCLDQWRGGHLGKQVSEAMGGDVERLSRAAAELLPRVVHLREIDATALRAAHGVLSRLYEHLQQELRRRGALSFEGLLRAAERLLRCAPHVRARLQERIDQLLVDEFQDTDRLQCAIIAALALEGPPQRRPGLFLVGDPKQSIYGWRNADLEAYEALVRRVEELGGRRRTLSRNHRSSNEILTEVERVIAPHMQPEPGIQPAFQPLCSALGSSPADEPAVEHWLSLEWDADAGAPAPTLAARATELEARWLASDLAARHGAGGLRWRDVAILLRSTGDLDIYVEALRQAGIPFVVDRDRSFARRREIQDAKALVRATLDPNDQLAVLATLRSAWVGVPDAAWVPLFERGFPRWLHDLWRGEAQAGERLRAGVEEVAQQLARADVPGIDHIAGWERSLLDAIEVLASLQRAFESEPPERFVERLRTRTLLEPTEGARYLGRHRLRHLERFFRDLEETLLLHPGDRGAVLAHLRTRATLLPEPDGPPLPEPGEDAVQILTIHQSKGLGFRHVYLLQLHHGRGRGTRAGLECAEIEGRLELRLATEGARIATPGFDQVAARRQRVEAAERVRTLYVAMTRARERLVLAGGWPAGKDGAGGYSHARLVQEAREEAARAVLERLGEKQDGQSLLERDGVGWRVLGIDPPRVPSRPGRSAAAPPAAASLRRDAERLRQARDQARRRQGRPIGSVASAGEPAGPEEKRLAPARPQGAPSARSARAVGRALHRLLERFDWQAADLEAAFQAALDDLRRELAAQLEGAALADAEKRAGEAAARLRQGGLWKRLGSLAPHVVARELPLIARPPDAREGPLGFVSGVVDLVYRDPESGELVVVDFKTDRIPDEDTLRARVAGYAEQGRLYAFALQDGLGLARAPRIELWFLDADRIVRVDAPPSPSG